MTPEETKQRRYIARELKILHKELGWIQQHIANIHDAVKVPEDNPIIDPNQLTIFDAIEERENQP